MNRKTTLSLLGLVVAIIGISAVIGFNNRGASAQCESAVTHSYKAMIMDGKVSDPQINGKLCDTITFTNMDHLAREIAFGPHEDHVAYDGVPEKVLNQNQSFTITLNQAGSFHWHDHEHDEVEGYFTVTK